MNTAHTFHQPYKLRAAADGTLEGICVPFGEVSPFTEHAEGERFTRGAFTKTLKIRGPRKVRLKSLHSEVMPVGIATELEEQDGGLFGRFRLYDTPEGRGARERALDGVYGGMSIEFLPVKERRADDGVTEVTEAILHAVALEIEPAYQGAQVMAVRSAKEERAKHAWLWEKVPTVPESDPMAGVDFTRFI